MIEVTSENKQDYYNRKKEIEISQNIDASVSLSDPNDKANDVLRVKSNQVSSINMGKGNDSIYIDNQFSNSFLNFGEDGGRDVVFLPKNKYLSFNVLFESSPKEEIFFERKGNDLLVKYNATTPYNDENSVLFKNFFYNENAKFNINFYDNNSSYLNLSYDKYVVLRGQDDVKNSFTYKDGDIPANIIGGNLNDRITVSDSPNNFPIYITPKEGNDYTTLNADTQYEYFFNTDDGEDVIDFRKGDLTLHLEAYRGSLDLDRKGNNLIINFENIDPDTPEDKLTIKNYYSSSKNQGKLYICQNPEEGKRELRDFIEIGRYTESTKKDRTIISGTKEADNIYLNQGIYDSDFKKNADILSGAGDDYINVKHAWNDNIKSDTGNDTINVGTIQPYGQTIIDAGKGHDEIYVDQNSGDATIYGGDGKDTIVVDNAGNGIEINGGAGCDSIKVNYGSAIVDLGTAQNGSEFVETADGNDFIQASKDKNIDTTIISGAGNDTINAGKMNTGEIYAGEGDDVINLQNSSNILVFGEDGKNTYNLDRSKLSFIDVSSNDNTVNAGSSMIGNVSVSANNTVINCQNSKELGVNLGENAQNFIINFDKSQKAYINIGSEFNSAKEYATGVINGGTGYNYINIDHKAKVEINLNDKSKDVISFNCTRNESTVEKQGNDLIVKRIFTNSVATIKDYFVKNIDRLSTKISFNNPLSYDSETLYLRDLAPELGEFVEKHENEYVGSKYSDSIDALQAANVTIKSGNGCDSIKAGDGDNIIDGGNNSDEIISGNGNSTIHAGEGVDQVVVGNGDNIIYGDRGYLSSRTGDGNNLIYTSDKTNSIITGTGNDTIIGKSKENVYIQDFGGNNNIKLGNSINSVETGDGNDTIITGSNNDTISSGLGSDSINAGRGYNEIMVSMEGSDTIVVNSNYKTSDTISFSDVETLDELVFKKDGNNLSVYSDSALEPTDHLTLQNFFKYKEDKHSISELQVGSGDVVDFDDIEVNIDVNSADKRGNLYGTYLNDVFTLNSSNLNGKIINLSGGNDKVVLEDINFSDILGMGYLPSNKKDLLLVTKDESILTVKNYFAKKTGASPSVNTVEFANGQVLTGDDFIPAFSIKDMSQTKSNTYKGDFTPEHIYGTDKNNVIYGYSGSDTIEAGDGKDRIYAGDNYALEQGEGDYIIGGLGNDTIYTSNETTHVEYNSGDGIDSVYRNKQGSTTYYEMKNFTSDSIYNDFFLKKERNDLAIINANNEEEKVLIKNYFSKSKAKYEDIIVNADGSEEFNIQEQGKIETLYDGSKTFKVEGTSLIDYINTTSYDKNISVKLGDGDDSIKTGNGNNTIYGDAGNDTIITGYGNDKIYGGDGNDSIDACSGKNYINAGTGENIINVTSGDNTIVSGNGVDTLKTDVASFMSFKKYKNDLYIDVNAGQSKILIKDYYKGNHSVQYIQRGKSSPIEKLSDILYNDNSIVGTDESDYIVGKDGYNCIDSGAGHDTILGGYSNEITSESGSNLIFGGLGSDSITTGSGNDTIYSSREEYSISTDSINSGSGDDIIVSVGVANRIQSGLGNDTINVSSFDSNKYTVIADDGGDDVYNIQSGKANIYDVDGNNVINMNLNKDAILFDLDNPSGITIYSLETNRDLVMIGDSVIQTINSNDGYTISNTNLENLKSDVANWISGSEYSSFDEVMSYGTEAEIKELTQIYNNAWSESVI